MRDALWPLRTTAGSRYYSLALRVRDGGSSNVLRLQARLFLADEPTAEQRQVQLEHLRGGFADALARKGGVVSPTRLQLAVGWAALRGRY